MKAGADQNLPNSWKLTPLSVALQKNHLGIVKKLLSYPTTDVNCKDDEGRTLISSSLSKFTADTFEYMKYLIMEKNADVKIADLQEKTPLHYAVLLSRKDAKQYYNKWNEMCKAERRDIKNKYEQLVHEMIELLINAGSDVNVQDSNGQTPFIQSLMSQNFKVSELIMKLTTPVVNYVDKKDRNILHKLIECRLFLNVKGFSILENIIKTIDPSFVNQYDENGWNPLLYLISEYTSTAEQHYADIYNKKVSMVQQTIFEEKLKVLLEEEERINQEKKLKNNGQEEEDDKKKNKKQDNDDDDDDDEDDGEEGDEEGNEEEDHEYEEENEDEEDNEDNENDENDDEENSEDDEDEDDDNHHNAPKKCNRGLLGSTNVFSKPQANAVQYNTEYNYLSIILNVNNTIIIKDQYHTKTFYHKNKPVIVFLNQDQVDVLTKESIQECWTLQETVIKLYQLLINLGADSNSSIIKRKQFREQKQVDQENVDHPYIDEGGYTIAHFIFKQYHSASFLQEINKITAISLIEAAQQNMYPIHLFANSCQMVQVCGRENETSQTFLEYVINKIDVTVKDIQLNTPTSLIGIRYNFTLDGILDILISNGGSLNNLNQDDIVPLQYWVKQNNVKVVGIFLTKFKADPNFPDKSKRTALHHAINSSNSEADASFEMEHLLIKNGANTNAVDIYKRTPLFYAFTKMTYDNDFREIDPFETVSSVLADKHCEVDSVDIHLRSPLHYAAMRGSVISGRY